MGVTIRGAQVLIPLGLRGPIRYLCQIGNQYYKLHVISRVPITDFSLGARDFKWQYKPVQDPISLAIRFTFYCIAATSIHLISYVPGQREGLDREDYVTVISCHRKQRMRGTEALHRNTDFWPEDQDVAQWKLIWLTGMILSLNKKRNIKICSQKGQIYKRSTTHSYYK